MSDQESPCRSFWNFEGRERSIERAKSRSRIKALTKKVEKVSGDKENEDEDK
tara:strand:- start:901 stop:1056 length:156 start_codon:yes stop_codon:yes gene_type:complete